MLAKTYPFTENQLRYFQQEILEADGIYELMFQKEVLKEKDGMILIAKYDNVEEYKQKYLVGIYEPLRSIYKSKIPYVFWSKMYRMLEKL